MNHKLGISNGARIIVVDDDPMIGKLLTTFLGEREYEVNYFTSPQKALTCLRLLGNTPNPVRSEHNQRNNLSSKSDCSLSDASNGVNLLLTDLQMPEMSGIELVRAAKILCPALPVIVMSGSADGAARDEIFSLGADFIPKPFELADLLKRIDLQVTLGIRGMNPAPRGRVNGSHR